MMVPVSLQPQPDGRCLAEAPDFAGCSVIGTDEGDSLARIKPVIEGAVGELLLAGHRVPEPQPISQWQRATGRTRNHWYEVHINLAHIEALARHQHGM